MHAVNTKPSWKYSHIFVNTVRNGAVTLFNWLVRIGGYATKLGDFIPHDTVALVVHWILQIAVTGGIVIGIIMIICKLIKWLMKVFKKKYADEYSLAAVLAELAIFVVFAEDLKKLPVNIVLAFLVVFGTYMGVREVIGRRRKLKV